VLIRDAEHAGGRIDLRLEGDRIAEIGARLWPRSGEDDFDARGGALLPGLHDHHLHLLSLAASLDSIACGPPDTCDAAALRSALESAPPEPSWLRGTGYFESVAGPLDRDVLDRFCPNRPLRIQHRSGSMWFLNSRAIDALHLDSRETPIGVERDGKGMATGRVTRLDAWLRELLPPRADPDLSRVGQLLAGRGVTGVTDATPTNGRFEFQLFREAQRRDALPQQLWLMGSTELSSQASTESLVIGARKFLLDETALPDLDALAESIREAHMSQRPVAIHSVTRSEILYALAAIEIAGPLAGDRLEHASIAPPEAVESARRLALTVVTQPNFVAERGDAYLRNVEASDQAYLYRLGGWLDAGVALGGGTDAPFGLPDPWRAMRAAVERRAPSGELLGASEAISPERALALFTTRPGAPGGRPRELRVGARADLCLLDVPWSEARQQLDCERIAATFCGGRLIWRSADHKQSASFMKVRRGSSA